VRLAAATVEVLVLGASAIERSLPQLAQVGVDVAIAVVGPGYGIAQDGAAASAASLCTKDATL
jgi:hypothetical protein